MKLYTDSELTNTAIGIKYFTAGALTTGVSVMNFSSKAFTVFNSMGQLGVVPPFFTRVFNVNSSERCHLEPIAIGNNAVAQPGMFVDVEYLYGSVVPSTTALAQIPAYNTTMTGTVNATIVGGVDATITNANISTQVVNTTGSAVNVKSVGYTMSSFSISNPNLDLSPYTLISAGGYIVGMTINVKQWGNVGEVHHIYLTNNGQKFAEFSAFDNWSQYVIDFKTGVPCNGISAWLDIYTDMTGFGIMTS